MKNNIRFTISAIFFCCFYFAFVFTANAQEVVCPVCGKSFPANTEDCPNDGTDLKALGIVMDTDPEEDDEQEEEDGLQDIPVVEEDDSSDRPRYQRMDSGQGRKANSTEDKEVDYSDRKSRILGDNRGTNSRSKRRQRQRELAAMAQKDAELRAKYEKIRAQAWRNRQRVQVEEVLAEKNRKRAKNLLLNGLAAPLTSLGYRMFWMGQGNLSGPVSAVEIDLNITRYKLRTGLSSLIGMRSLPDRNDLIFLEHIAVGLQLPRRFSPYVVARGGIGVLASGDGASGDSGEFLTSVGGEIGVDSWMSPWMSITPSAGYSRCMTYNTAWNSFTFKVSVGF